MNTGNAIKIFGVGAEGDVAGEEKHMHNYFFSLSCCLHTLT